MAKHTIELSDEAEQRLERLLAGGYDGASVVFADALESLEADLAYDKQVQDFRAMAEEAFAEAEGPDAIVLNSPEELTRYMDDKLRRAIERHELRGAQTAA